MPTVLMIVPEAGGIVDLQLLEGETLNYDSGLTMAVNEDTVTFYATLPDPLPANITINPVPVYDTSDPENPVITGYNVTTRSEVVVSVIRGGWSAQSQIPAADTPPDTVVVRVQSTNPMLTTIDTRLQAINALYGIVPGHEVQPDG